MRALDQIWRELFEKLKAVDYDWKPAKPDRLLEYRKSGSAYPLLQRFFGLGLETRLEELVAEGFSPELAREVLELAPSISRNGGIFVPHSHWPAQPGVDYVYLGEESFELLKFIQPHLDRFEKSNVLDLGSGSGALLFEVASFIGRGLGIDSSEKAVRWSQAAAHAQGLDHLSFYASKIGSPEAESAAHGVEWNIAILNPPFAIPIETEARPHRDGGNLGIELPLLFLQFASRHLVKKGEVFCLVTNPIVHGRSAFFDQLDRRVWETLEKKCFHDHFNHTLYRKERYAERGIQRVELWYLHLRKN